MAVYKRPKGKRGPAKWRAVVRVSRHKTVCKTCDREKEARDWEIKTKQEIKNGIFNYGVFKKKYTFHDLIEHHLQSGALEHHKSAKDTRPHLAWWDKELGAYDLRYLKPELIAQKRQSLLETEKVNGKKITPATVNRYLASLSGILSYACRLEWMDSNPCFKIFKLKEPPGKRLQEEMEFLPLKRLLGCYTLAVTVNAGISIALS